jgi:hypothetical protein
MTISRPWLIALGVVLFLSLAINFLIAGFTAARFHGPPRGGPDFIERIVAIGIRAFPPQIQSAIRERTDAERAELRALVDAVQDSRMRMLEAMRAEPFDGAALDAAFADLRARVNALQAAGQTIVGEAVAAAPADVRANIRLRRGPFP